MQASDKLCPLVFLLGITWRKDLRVLTGDVGSELGKTFGDWERTLSESYPSPLH